MLFSTHHNVDHPLSLYAATKKSNELMANTYNHLFSPTTGLRFFTVYGPWGRPDMALFILTEKILKGEPIDVYDHGKMERDFTYVDDIIEGVVRVLENPAKGKPDWDSMQPDPGTSPAPHRVYNIGNNNPVKLMDFYMRLKKQQEKRQRSTIYQFSPGMLSKHGQIQKI
jgi:UDP-glucuronate 4-epimerase